MKNEKLLSVLLKELSSLFKNPELYKEISEVPAVFTKVMDKDILVDYMYFEKLSHPIF